MSNHNGAGILNLMDTVFTGGEDRPKLSFARDAGGVVTADLFFRGKVYNAEATDWPGIITQLNAKIPQLVTAGGAKDATWGELPEEDVGLKVG